VPIEHEAKVLDIDAEEVTARILAPGAGRWPGQSLCAATYMTSCPAT
jgi:hypothetical protein